MALTNKTKHLTKGASLFKHRGANLELNMTTPSDTQIDIIFLHTNRITKKTIENLMHILSDREIQCARQILNSEEKNQFILSRTLLRTALHDITSVPPNNWVIETTEFGKPYISAPVDYTNVTFSSSHSNGLISCALTARRSVGIDVEFVNVKTDIEPIAKRLFTREEYQDIVVRPISERTDAFYKYWTLKEAYAKARGDGMLLNLDVSFVIDPRAEFRYPVSDSSAHWYFKRIEVTPSHMVTLAYSGVQRENIHIVCNEYLVNGHTFVKSHSQIPQN